MLFPAGLWLVAVVSWRLLSFPGGLWTLVVGHNGRAHAKSAKHDTFTSGLGLSNPAASCGTLRLCRPLPFQMSPVPNTPFPRCVVQRGGIPYTTGTDAQSVSVRRTARARVPPRSGPATCLTQCHVRPAWGCHRGEHCGEPGPSLSLRSPPPSPPAPLPPPPPRSRLASLIPGGGGEG